MPDPNPTDACCCRDHGRDHNGRCLGCSDPLSPLAAYRLLTEALTLAGSSDSVILTMSRALTRRVEGVYTDG